MLLRDKTVIVSGASRGIGKAIALELAREGANISFNFLTGTKNAEELEQEIHNLGVRVKKFQTDVRDYQAVKSWVDETKEFFGAIHVVVNNAGVIRDGALALMQPDDWRRVISTNLDGTFHVTRAAIVEFMKQKSGVIVNISSVSGMIGLPRQTNYSSSKAGIIGFTKALAREVAPYNIRVNAVAPGFIETDMLVDLKAGYRDQLVQQIPLKRFGTAGEVARTVRFLTSDDSRYITGQTIVIDGGMSCV